MMKRVAVILAIVVVIIVVTLFVRAMRFLEIDSCVDSGGAWNHEEEICGR